MAGATIWKGFIRIGKTDVPVKLHTAVSGERIGFHLLHREDGVRLRQQMICAFDKQPVPSEEQTRGFEVEDGKYLLLAPGEPPLMISESSRMIEVHEFVKAAELDPRFLDRVYYLEPGMQGKGYGALAGALADLGVAGICTWAMRKRTYLGALTARGKALRLNALRHADEVVTAESLGLQQMPLSEKELAVGSELIEKLTVPFEPRKFVNDHEKKLRQLIERKSRGESVTVITPRRLPPTESDRLLEALEASLKRAA